MVSLSVSFTLVLFAQFAVRSLQSPLREECLYDRGDFAANSTYAANLNRLISSFTSLRQSDGFYNISVGETDEVNSIVLCRGDVNPADCISCVSTAGRELTKRCLTKKEAIIWYDNCMVRYSSRVIFNRMETEPWFSLWNTEFFAGDRNESENVLRSLLESLSSKAAAGGGRKKFAAANISAPLSQTLYGLVQCTPDLSEQDCKDCLAQSFGNFQICCGGQRGGRWMNPSCNFRYELYSFYDPEAVEDPTPAPAPVSSPPSAN